MEIRSAISSDAQALSDVLQEIVAVGKRNSASDVDYARTFYIEDPQNIQCSIAIDKHEVVIGFQVLKLAAAGNPYNTPSGWGIIGTHVSPRAARTGIGRKLFASTCDAARRVRLKRIEAYIQETNADGLAYYEALGFRTYRSEQGAVCKLFEIGYEHK